MACYTFSALNNLTPSKLCVDFDDVLVFYMYLPFLMNIFIRSYDTNLTFLPYVWEAQQIYRLFSTMSSSEEKKSILLNWLDGSSRSCSNEEEISDLFSINLIIFKILNDRQQLCHLFVCVCIIQ